MFLSTDQTDPQSSLKAKKYANHYDIKFSFRRLHSSPQNESFKSAKVLEKVFCSFVFN